MNPQLQPHWSEIERIFDEALACADSERAAFVQAACAGDELLRREVEALLAADQKLQQAPRLLASPLHQTNGTPPKLGAYQLQHEIARGGMGAVWLAHRADEQFEQQVAIKLLRAGANHDDLQRRFYHERQILADLNHPNIARLLDGGTTPEGQPYFVMEYIEGVPVDEYCQQQQLSVRERLLLFRQVCAAVQYAHQHLIIHRDLKPANILVTADGTPKLLDFGIAKLLQPNLADSYHTQSGLHPMTPAYASPEQIRGENLTTASDVYSLGVVLYELLTERSPYQLKENTFGELSRAICEQEPVRPSAAVTGGTTSSIRNPRSATRNLKGDLDSIVLMALRKEHSARYSSVEQFSADIQRYLDGLPTLARKGTFAYRTVKYLRRYKVPVAAAALIVLSLLGGIGATSRQAQIARAAQAKAEAQRIRAEHALAVAGEQRRRAEQALAEVEAQRTRAENALTTADQRRLQAEAARNEANQQRAAAETQRLAAEAERNVAQTQRQRAEAQELSKRQLLYASQMKLAQAAWDEANVERVHELLTAHQPAPGQEDLRGFEWDWLWRLSHAEVTTLPKHPIAPVAGFSANGKSLITSHYAPVEKVNVIRVWDTATWLEKSSVRVSGPTDWQSAISPDGRLVAVPFVSRCEILLWDVASAQARWKLPLPGACRRILLFSPDSKRLIALSRGQMILFDTQSGREMSRFNVQSWQPDKLQTIAFHPDGKRIATVGLDFQVHLYDVFTGKEVQTIERPNKDEKIGSISYSPTGRYLVLGTSPTKVGFTQIVIQDTQTQHDVLRVEAISLPSFSPNEQYLVVPKDREIRILDTQKWEERAAFKVQTVDVVAFAPNSERFVTAGLDSVKIWDVSVSPSATSYVMDNVFVRQLTFSPDSKKMYAQAYSPPQISNYSITKGWDLTTKREVNSLLSSGSPTSRHSLSPDGEKLAYHDKLEILIKSTRTNAELLRIKTNGGECRDIFWSVEGRKLVAVIGITIGIWDAQTGQIIQAIPTPPAMQEVFRKVVILRDQKTLLILGEAALYFYDLMTRQFIRTIPLQDGLASSMTLSADETKFAIGFLNGDVRLYDATNGEELLTLKGHSRFINQLSFTSDNRRLATSSQDSTVRVWDLLTGQEILLFRDTASGGGVAFSPDGEHLAVAYQRGVVKVFSAAK